LRRLATTVVTAGLLVAVSFFTVREVPQLGRAVADETYTLNPNKFLPSPTPTVPPPTATPLPPTPWPTPDPLDGGGSVAFTLRRNGNSDLYVLSIGQSQPVRLTNHPADDRDPAWSPDGSELAFASRRDGNWELYILSIEDGELRRLTDDRAFDGGPAWSPDGEWLVFESYRDGNLDLYIMKTDGSAGPIRLTEDPAPDFAPVWAPGGRHIAFTSWRSGNKDIFILDLDAAADAGAVNITSSPSAFEDDPAFNPAGDYLAYHDDSTGFELIYAMPLAGYQPAGEPVSYGQGRHPTWSPEGAALAYVHGNGREDGQQSHLIAGSLDAWSVAPQAFTADGRLDHPAWSPRTMSRNLSDHLQRVNETVDAPLFVEEVATVQGDGPPYLVLQLPVNAPAPYLNDRVDQSFLALRDHVINAAGWDFLGELDNMFAVLDTPPLPEQSNQTWNKAGRAFDYYARHVLSFEPQLEIVRENEGNELYWRTYLLAAQQDGTQGEPLRDLPWDFRARYGAEPQYYDKGGKWRDGIPAGYYVDFTALATDYGWRRVPAGEQWRTYFPAILFWHYENRQGLTGEEALLELFTPEQIADTLGP
jgi:TolB protein